MASTSDGVAPLFLLPARFDRWMSQFLKRHGATATNVVNGMLVGVAQDGTRFEAALPFGRPYDGPERTDDFLAAAYPPTDWGLLLVRQGGYAVALVNRERIVSSKVAQRFLPRRGAGPSRWSMRWLEERWLARRREIVAERAITAAASHAQELIGSVNHLVVGGDFLALAEVMRRAGLSGRVVARLPDIREPRRGVFEEAVIDARSVRMTVTSAEEPRPARWHMWQPAPEWTPVPSGRGALTTGIWRTVVDGRSWFVKRVHAPGDDDPDDYLRLDSPTYWRREVEFAYARLGLRGLTAPEVGRVDEDPEGFTLWTLEHERIDVGPEKVAQALGEFSTVPLPSTPWLARDHLRSRLAPAAERGGWPTLARTTVADHTEALWARRKSVLTRLESLPRVPVHGDLVTENVLRQSPGAVVVADWSAFGLGAPGEDLAMYALSGRRDFASLVPGYKAGLAVDVSTEDLLWVGRVITAFTVATQAEWGLARAASGEGPLAAKYGHPAVARYLYALQSNLDAIDAVIGG